MLSGGAVGLLMIFSAGSSVKFSLGFYLPQAASEVVLWEKKHSSDILCYPVPGVLNKIILNHFGGALK